MKFLFLWLSLGVCFSPALVYGMDHADGPGDTVASQPSVVPKTSIIDEVANKYDEKIKTAEEEIEDLKEKIKKQKSHIGELEFYCTDPLHSCAQDLANERALLAEMENQLAAKEQYIAQLQGEKETQIAQARADESARKKAKRQKQLLMLSTLASAGMGAYLLYKCKKSKGQDKASCIMGALALGQALISYKSKKDMGETENQFASQDPGDDNSGPVVDLCTNEYITCDANGNPQDSLIPCPGNPTSDCILSRDGRRIIPVTGGPGTTTTQLAKGAPTGPKVDQALQEAMKDQKELLAQIREIDPNYNPASFKTTTTYQAQGTSPGASPPPGNTQAKNGGTSSQQPKGPSTITSFTGGYAGQGSSGTGSGGSNDLYSQFAGGTVGGGGSGESNSGTRDSDRGQSGQGSDNSFAEQESQASGLRGFFRQLGSQSGSSSSAKNSIPFGNTRVGAAHTNIFSLAQDRYLNLRDRGEFYEGPIPSGSGGSE